MTKSEKNKKLEVQQAAEAQDDVQTAGVEAAPVVTGRSKLLERYRKDNEEFADDDEAIYNAALEELGKADETAEQRKRFNEAVASSDIAPELLAGVLSGKNSDGSAFDLESYLFEKNIDFFMDYLEDNKTALDKMKARKGEAAQMKAAEEEFKKQREENVKAEDAALDEALKETGYKESEVKDLIEWIYGENGILSRAASCELTKDDFVKLIHLKDFDVKLAEAGEAGYKKGKNEKIDMFQHKQKSRGAMPADIGNGGGRKDGKTDSQLEALDKIGKAFG